MLSSNTLRRCVAGAWLLVGLLARPAAWAAEPGPHYVIGFSQCTMNDAWRQAMLAGMKKELSFYPNVEFRLKDAHDNSALQQQQLRGFLQEKVDLLIVSANEAEPITPLVEEAFNRGIPVIILDRRTTSKLYTGNHGFGNAGLLSIYVAADANKVYVFLAGTLETASDNTVRNSLQVYFGRPGVTTGVATGVALPKPPSSTPITSFDQVISKNDFPVDFAIGVKGTTTAAQAQVDGAVYTGGSSPSAVAQPVATGLNVTTGAPATVSSIGSYVLFNGAVVAFKNSSNLASNPGAPTGAAGSTGLEFSLSRTSLSIPATGGPLYVFGLQNNADGDFFSSDIIPQNTGAAPGADANGNLQRGPDFTAIPGLQFAILRLSATGGVLGSQAAAAAQVFGLQPNPVAAGSAVQVQLTQPADQATYTLRNVLGQVLQTRAFTGTATTVATDGLPAGTYLLTVASGTGPAVTSRVQVY